MHVMNKEEGAGAGRVSCQIKMLTKMEDWLERTEHFQEALARRIQILDILEPEALVEESGYHREH
jgi:hypothetical protein